MKQTIERQHLPPGLRLLRIPRRPDAGSAVRVPTSSRAAQHRPAGLACAVLGALLAATPVLAQGGRPATPPPPAAAPQAPAPRPADPRPESPASEPARTTATYDDWTLRCERPAGALVCEVVQGLTSGNQRVAAFAVGRLSRSEPLRLTLLVPHNVALDTRPRLLGAEGERDAPALDLTWRRCLPAGCLADSVLSDDLLRRLRARTEPLRLLLADGAGREAVLPFSTRGLGPALDALAREGAR